MWHPEDTLEKLRGRNGLNVRAVPLDNTAKRLDFTRKNVSTSESTTPKGPTEREPYGAITAALSKVTAADTHGFNCRCFGDIVD